METAPLREVVRVVEVRGPRGGTIHALVLSCGCFMTRRLKDGKRPPLEVPCLACFVNASVRKKLEEETSVSSRASFGTGPSSATSASPAPGGTRSTRSRGSGPATRSSATRAATPGSRRGGA